MLQRQYAPPAPLDGLVTCLWLFEGFSGAHERERVLPTGTIELVINLREDETRVYDERDGCLRLAGAVLSGPHARPFVIDTAEQASVIGVHFAPGGAFPFFAVGASGLRDQHVPLEALWGVAAVRRLREQLLEARSPGARLQTLEAALTVQLRRARTRHPLVAHALRALDGGLVSVGDVIEQSGYSARRLISLFDDEVGLTPKLYQRVRRFQRVLGRIHRGCADWIDLALDAGFFDQAHLIRDFRAFSGLTPRQYLQARTPHLNHVPLL